MQRQNVDALGALGALGAASHAPERQSCLMLHRARHLLVRQQTAAIERFARSPALSQHDVIYRYHELGGFSDMRDGLAGAGRLGEQAMTRNPPDRPGAPLSDWLVLVGAAVSFCEDRRS